MEETEFQKFVLLYEELVRKETLLGSLLNPNEVSGYYQNPKTRGIPEANKTVKIFYGITKAEELLDEYNMRKKQVEQNNE